MLLQGLASKEHDVTADHMIALLAMRDDMSKSKVKQVCYILQELISQYRIYQTHGVCFLRPFSLY